MTVHEVLAAMPGRIADLLAVRGLGEQQLGPLLDWPAEDGVLVTGSYAESLETRASDIDLIVLRETAEPLVDVAAARGLPLTDVQASTFIDRILTVVGNVEFDIWLVSRDRMDSLSVILGAALDDDGTIHSIPGLQYLEDKLLCRLYEGIVLQNEPRVMQWRRSLRTDHLPGLLTAMLLGEAISLLEDAVVLPEGREAGGLATTTGGMVAGRAAAERLLRASLASVGIVGWDLRYATLFRERLLAAAAPVPHALLALEDLLFPRAPTGEGAAVAVAEYTSLIAHHVRMLVSELDRRPRTPGVRDFLAKLAPDRWTLDSGVIGLGGPSPTREGR